MLLLCMYQVELVNCIAVCIALYSGVINSFCDLQKMIYTGILPIMMLHIHHYTLFIVQHFLSYPLVVEVVQL